MTEQSRFTPTLALKRKENRAEKTRILFVIDGMEFGGGERVFTQIMNGLPKDRYELYLASGEQESFYRAITTASVKRYGLDFSNRYNIAILYKLLKIIKGDEIQIIHGQGGRAEFFARLASRIAGSSRYISTVAMPVEGYDVGPKTRVIYETLDGFTERYVDYFLVVSAVLEQTMIEGHGISPEKVIKIYNGIETTYYRPENLEESRRQIREEFSLGNDEILIGAVGRMVWQKGFAYFLQALPSVTEDIPQARFMLVGDGPMRQELEGLAKSLGIQDRLLLTGHRRDIRDMMAAMDIAVIPSLLEGFPMVTLEAMAMERPIVATAIDGITEQISDGVEGLLVPARDPGALARAIKRMADDPPLARALANRARKRVVDDFSVQKMITETVKVYERL